MTIKAIINEALRTISQDESDGKNYYNGEAVRSLLKVIEQAFEGEGSPESSQIKLERYKADLTNWLAVNNAKWQFDLEEFRQIIVMGQSAMKGSLIINGGASVALLAFIGHLASSSIQNSSIVSFANAMMFYVFGTGMAAVAFGTTYLSQHTYAEMDDNSNLATALQIVTILIVVLSFIAFFFGSGTAYHGFIKLAG